MARPKKRGLEYFPMDVDFFSDIKIRKLIKYQGGRAVTVYALLLCNIYKDGYYIRWDEELPFILSESSGYDEAYIGEVIKCCLRIGLFDSSLYEKESILTSEGIQSRYRDIIKMSHRSCDIDEFCLVTSPKMRVSSEETPVKSEETPVNSEKSTQSKVKESKEKKNSFSVAGLNGQKQQEQYLFKIFFFRNFLDPSAEVKRFIDWNTLRGWRLRNGEKITTLEQLKSAAMFWSPAASGGKYEGAFLAMWGSLFSLAPDDMKDQIADQRVSYFGSSVRCVITCSMSVFQWLKSVYDGEEGVILKKFLKGRSLEFKTY